VASLPGERAAALVDPSRAIQALDRVATCVGDHELGVIGISAATRNSRRRGVAILSVAGPDVSLRRRGATRSRRSCAVQLSSAHAHSTPPAGRDRG
jgi:DNA-binding IclR family transcriptional regulator